jgi:hypothetical protein
VADFELAVAFRKRAKVRFGSISEVGPRKRHVRFPPASDQTADIAVGPFRARRRHGPLLGHSPAE